MGARLINPAFVRSPDSEMPEKPVIDPLKLEPVTVELVQELTTRWEDREVDESFDLVRVSFRQLVGDHLLIHCEFRIRLMRCTTRHRLTEPVEEFRRLVQLGIVASRKRTGRDSNPR